MKQLLVFILLFPFATTAQHKLRCAAIADDQAQWKLIDTNGNVISDIHETYERNYRGCEGYSEGMFCHEKLGKLGFKNWKGIIVVKPVFNEGRTFTNGCAAVKASKWGMVNRAGKLIADTIYDYISDADSLGTIVVEKDHRLGIIDKSGRVVLPCSYYNDDKLFPQPVFSDGLLKVLSRRSTINEPDASGIKQIGNAYSIKIGFIDRQGVLVIDTVYDLVHALRDSYYDLQERRQNTRICGTGMRRLRDSRAFEWHHWYLNGDFYRFEGTRCVVFKGYTPFVINRNGDSIYTVAHSWRGLKNTGGYIIAGQVYPNHGRLSTSLDGLPEGSGVYNPDGKEIIPFIYSDIGPLCSGFFKVEIQHDSVDERGQLISRDISCRYADSLGQFMQPKFSAGGDFANGIATVGTLQARAGCNDGQINTKGKLLLWGKNGTWVEGTKAQKFFIAWQGEKFGLMDADFNWTIQPIYESCQAFTSGLAAVKLNGKWGYINTKGDLIIQPKFQMALPFSDIAVDK